MIALLAELPLQKSKTEKEIIYTGQPGEEITISHSDNKEWFLVRTKSGTNGWFSIDPGGIIGETGMWSGEIFEGLCTAD